MTAADDHGPVRADGVPGAPRSTAGPRTVGDSRTAADSRTAGASQTADASQTAGASSPAREKIIEAAALCIRRRGVERASISAIAATAGVSRPTVYAHFETRQAVIAEAMKRVSVEISEKVVESARRRARTAGEFVLEALVAVRREFRAEPALRPLIGPSPDEWNRVNALSAEALATARPIIAPVVDYDASLEPYLDEIVETSVRWLLSLLMFDSTRTASEQRLRAYLRRSVIPVIDALSAAPDAPATSTKE